MLCAMRRRELPNAAEICSGARRIAVLENVMNPTNIGAIMRSAAALNMDAVLLTPGCSNPLYRRAARVSMGTVFQIPWTFLREQESGVWPDEGMRYLKELGFKTASMALHDESVDIDDRRLRDAEKLAVHTWNRGRRALWQDDRTERSYGQNSYVSWRGLPERGGGKRGGILGDGKKNRETWNKTKIREKNRLEKEGKGNYP